MDACTRRSVSVAAAVSGLAFTALIVGLPLILNDLASLESQFALEREAYMEMSNKMWRELMSQTEEIRTSQAGRRERRQCEWCILALTGPFRLNFGLA